MYTQICLSSLHALIYQSNYWLYCCRTAVDVSTVEQTGSRGAGAFTTTSGELHQAEWPGRHEGMC